MINVTLLNDFANVIKMLTSSTVPSFEIELIMVILNVKEDLALRIAETCNAGPHELFKAIAQHNDLV